MFEWLKRLMGGAKQSPEAPIAIPVTPEPEPEIEDPYEWHLEISNKIAEGRALLYEAIEAFEDAGVSAEDMHYYLADEYEEWCEHNDDDDDGWYVDDEDCDCDNCCCDVDCECGFCSDADEDFIGPK